MEQPTTILHPYRPPADMSRFYVVTPISNPIRYSRRYELHLRFVEMCEGAGVKLITVEQAFGLRQFMVTQPDNLMHVQVRTVEELWHKENMINIGMQRAVELGAREIAWVDNDCRPSMMPKLWFEETWHQLQHYEFVQMFEWLIDLSLNYNPIGSPQLGFMADYIKHGSPNYEKFIELRKLHKIKPVKRKRATTCPCCNPPYPPPYPYGSSLFGRSGLAWAANVDALDKVGRLIDYAILGASDWYMAHGLIGMMQAVAFTEARSSKAYANKLLQWQTLCERWIKRDVGFVRGIVYHDYHGHKDLRGYGTRWNILVDNQYDPDTDIKLDTQGLYQLETYEPRQIVLRDQIRAYMRARNEDSTTGGED